MRWAVEDLGKARPLLRSKLEVSAIREDTLGLEHRRIEHKVRQGLICGLRGPPDKTVGTPCDPDNPMLVHRSHAEKVSQAAETIGARVLLVHARHEKAKAFSMKYGFEESPTDPLHLLTLLKDVRASLERGG